MFHVGGSRKSKSKNKSKKNMRRLSGGHSPLALSPGIFNAVDSMPTASPNFMDNANFNQSRQVGGDGFGFSNGLNAGVFRGSYPEATRYLASDNSDASRGGNNVLSGGSSSRGRGGSKKWKMKGCSKSCRKGGKHSHKHKKSKRHSKRHSKKSKRRSQKGGCGTSGGSCFANAASFQ